MSVTGGNVNDRSPVMDMVKGITGKLIGDKGYISNGGISASKDSNESAPGLGKKCGTKRSRTSR